MGGSRVYIFMSILNTLIMLNTLNTLNTLLLRYSRYSSKILMRNTLDPLFNEEDIQDTQDIQDIRYSRIFGLNTLEIGLPLTPMRITHAYHRAKLARF